MLPAPAAFDPSDDDLLRASASGDVEAFGRLVERHQARAFRFAQAVTTSREAAEDVLQQAMLSAWRSAGRFRGESSVRSWLLTIVRNAAFHDRARRAREPLDDRSLDELGIAAGWGAPSQERELIAREQRAALMRAMARLAEEEREVLVLRDIEGLGGDETAAVLQISVAAMKSRLHRARLRLAAEVRAEVIDAAR